MISLPYVYDYGDNWRRKVKVEKIVMPPEPMLGALRFGGRNAARKCWPRLQLSRA